MYGSDRWVERLDELAALVERARRGEEERVSTHARGHVPTRVIAERTADRLDTLAELLRAASGEASLITNGSIASEVWAEFEGTELERAGALLMNATLDALEPSPEQPTVAALESLPVPGRAGRRNHPARARLRARPGTRPGPPF